MGASSPPCMAATGARSCTASSTSLGEGGEKGEGAQGLPGLAWHGEALVGLAAAACRKADDQEGMQRDEEWGEADTQEGEGHRVRKGHGGTEWEASAEGSLGRGGHARGSAIDDSIGDTIPVFVIRV
jgi:hypothetical protein